MEDSINYINSFINGNTESFEKIVRKYERLIYSFISGKVPEKDMDDIAQETFIKVFINCSKLKNPASFKAWLFAICRNCINNYLRDKNNRVEQLNFIEDLTAKEEILKDDNPVLIIRRAISHIPQKKQPDLLLKYMCGFTYREMGALYGISEDLVKSRMFESRKILKQFIRNTKQNLFSHTSLRLQETIMEKIELIKHGAKVITRLSLDQQIKLCGFVENNQKFDKELLEAIGKITGGTKFVISYNGKLSISEFADLLCFVTKETANRIVDNYRQNNIDFSNELNKEMTLSDLKVLKNESFTLNSEQISDDNNSLVVSLKGYIDSIFVAKEFETKIMTLIESGYVNIILECRDFTYISSTGIGALIVIIKKIAAVEGNFIICNLNPLIWEIFTLLGISNYFVKKDSVNQAIEFCTEPDHPLEIKFESNDGIKRIIPETKGGDEYLDLFCYFKESQKPSYSYFDYKKISDNKWAIIRSAVSGKGVEAAAISAQISSNFHLFFEHNTNKYALDELVYMINSQILNLNFQNRFAHLSVLVIDELTGESSICSAGDQSIPYYSGSEKKMATLVLPQTPALGMFSNGLIRTKSPYSITKHYLKKQDTIYLMTDGIEESQRAIEEEPYIEELGFDRILQILNRQHKLFESSNRNIEKIINGLMEEVKLFKGDHKQSLDSDILVFAIQLL